ncbi:hypothetical protein BofuT4_uP057080.1 [Botrytis cinerea T4]|uniref:Secreted protein n=1 Tax=Botryotinia fuckeliana (strain T4) TaxID=999810 RepID=G2XUF8_BOTF4|nr:hypothetical protein BofuT4_uP057080.1 [Botrytis cinerea T4]
MTMFACGASSLLFCQIINSFFAAMMQKCYGSIELLSAALRPRSPPTSSAFIFDQSNQYNFCVVGSCWNTKEGFRPYSHVPDPILEPTHP